MQRLLQQLRASLAEETYVDDQGYAHDDQGNTWYVGKRYASGTYAAGRVKGGGGDYPWSESEVSDRIEFLDDVLRLKFDSFLASLLQQLRQRGSLTDKQKHAAYRALQKLVSPQWAIFFLQGGGRYKKGSVTLRGAPKPASGDARAEVLQTLIAKRPSNFLSSILQQLQRGRTLSDKQLAAVRQNLYKSGMKDKADLFR